MAPSIIADRYRVDRVVGRGGMGAVWLCTDELLGRTVAVKQVGHLPGGSTPDLARALREARSAAALNHPNVVSIFDAIEEGDQIWLVMEYVPSRTLSEIMTEEGSLDPERAAWIGAQVADGLAAAHLRGTMHRDVKPGNILVSDNDHAKISDFGIARTMGDAQLTQTGMVIGTPGYFSPQLARGEEPTPGDDVWALGATLFGAVEGHPPFPDQSAALATLSSIANAEQAPRPEQAGVLSEAIVHMMELDPGSRWTMADVAYHLHALCDQASLTGTQARVSTQAEASTATLAELVPGPESPATPDPDPVPAMAPPPTEQGRRRWPGALLGVAAALVVAVVALLLVRDDEPGVTPVNTGDEPSGQVSSEGEEPTDPGQTDDPPGSPPPTTSSPDGDAPAPASGDQEQFVADYYGLLPDDTAAAWPLLSPDMQAEVGSYEDYQGFWSTIDTVTVDDTAPSGSNAVDVTLTYVTDGSSEQETRLIELEETDDGFLIVGD